MRNLIRALTRPVAAASPRAGRSAIYFTGDYASWADAEGSSTGYNAEVILERTRAALLKVKNGEAAFERDSVLFKRPQYPFPVIAGLLRAAVDAGGRLAVVDFGGSLGSSYFQLRRFFPARAVVEWCVVEQPAHVACGREHFENNELRFFESVEECVTRHRPDILLLSSVLQYLPAPYSMLDRLLNCQFRHLIIDRTPFLVSPRDRLTVQHVPEWIYPASYPAWFFDESRVVEAIGSAGYVLMSDFKGSDDISPDGEPAYFKGFIYERVPRV